MLLLMSLIHQISADFPEALNIGSPRSQLNNVHVGMELAKFSVLFTWIKVRTGDFN